MEGRGNKRVRFEYDEPADDDEDSGPRKLKFPKGKKAGYSIDEDAELPEDALAEPDARRAAVERAARRSAMGEELRAEEDSSNITDVVQAEEGGPNGDNDNEPLEPFNLENERRDGYFDDNGHYVEYETKFEARDAWLDSTTVDARFAHQLLESDDDSRPEVSEEDKAEMKKRIAASLQPGETVLEGLRRLKGSKTGRREKLTGEAKAAFDQLTEDAMKLMDLGESDVYDKVREIFQREADKIKAKPKVLDMFSDDVDEANEVTPAAPTPEKQSPEETGYVLDPTSGYYYNAEVGYYYDPASGLFCSASSGQWFKFDEETNSYNEVV